MKAAGQEFKDVKKISLFLSSPGDMEREREKVHVVVSQVNRMMGNDYNVVLEVIEWKTHVAPDMGRPQEVINRQIGDYDIFVGIMWKRFGTPTGLAESGTEEEFNIAYANWEQFQRPRIMFYFNQTPCTLKTSSEIAQFGKVIAFKEKIQQRGLCFEYQTGEEFADLLREHLIMLLREWFKTVREGMLPIADFTRYLKYLKSDTMYIDVRGLVVGEGKAPQFRIDELYIPLKTSGVGLTEAKRTREERDLPGEAISREAPLQEALEEPLLFIKGDPGSGKTTFLRLITFSLCLKWLGEDIQEMRTRILWPEPPPLPVFIRIGALTQFIREYVHRDPIHCPIQEDSPEWLLYFLEDQSRTYNWQVSREMFHREFTDGHCLILLDGLDEAPNQAVRERMSSLAAKLPMAFDRCHVVMTSRPAALSGPALPMGFNIVEIEPLDEPAMEAFLSRWSSALYQGVPEKSDHYHKELKRALTSRPEIRRMASNPVMLTALAVVHWNEHRLPEQRAELYESILTWLFRAREQREGRLKADLCRRLLQRLALAMFTHPEGRQRQAGLRWAAETLAPEFREPAGCSSVEAAEYFLSDEMIDSGIVVERNRRLEFWHLSFQEYLAAYEIGGHKDQEQLEMLFQNERLYSSEWREVVLLLAGVLYEQGLDKINNLIDSVIGKGPEQATRETLPLLARASRVAGRNGEGSFAL